MKPRIRLHTKVPEALRRYVSARDYTTTRPGGNRWSNLVTRRASSHGWRIASMWQFESPAPFAKPTETSFVLAPRGRKRRFISRSSNARRLVTEPSTSRSTGQSMVPYGYV